MSRKSVRKYFIVGTVVFLSLIANAVDMSMKLVGQFHSVGGTIQFLPGGYVVTTEDGKSKQYVFRGAEFVASQESIAARLSTWTSFDWEGVDYLNQIDRKDRDPDLSTFLPNAARVKKVITLNQPTGKTLSLVCYTTKSAERFVPPDATDIAVMAVRDEESDPHKPAKFEKLWEKKLGANASYGQFERQSIPGVGEFVLLYSASSGGDSVDRTLAIYKVKD